MLDRFRAAGGKRISGNVEAIERVNGFTVKLSAPAGEIRTLRIVNAAGPFVNEIAAMLDQQLPVTNTVQQKIAFEDEAGIIPRNMPFSIDLDNQIIDWTEEEKELIAADAELSWLSQEMPGAIHCRPDSGEHSSWVKLGWAFNEVEELPSWETPLINFFPEIVVRGAARLNPGLMHYYDKMPRNMIHYGGYYTTTEENWPLIGETEIDGFFVVGAMSGFGSMAACAAGDLCAQSILGKTLPDYATALSPERYNNPELIAQTRALSSRGIL